MIPTLQLGQFGRTRHREFLLDIYPGAVAAYSLARRLGSKVTFAFRANWSADAGQHDVQFLSSGETDIASLQTAAGANTANAHTVLDQTGNARHLDQAAIAARPVVINAGTLQTCGTRVAAIFDGGDALTTFDTAPNFGTDTGLSGDAAYSVFIVHKKTTSTGGCLYGWGNTGTALNATGILDDNTNIGLHFAGGNAFNTTAFTNNTYFLTTIIKTAGAINATTAVYRNGSSVASAGHSTNTPTVAGAYPLALGQWANYASNRLIGAWQEMIIFAGDKSSDRAAIESNIRAFYGF
jgi:hypothetical protein